MIASEQIEKFKEFIEKHYQKQLNRAIKKGDKALILSFDELSRFDHDLAEQLLSDPEETVKAAELSLESFDLPESVLLKVRFIELPPSQKIKIRNIRSKDLDKLISIEGVIRQSSDVRPQVTSAKFECPACGNTITILQIDTKFKEPSRCSCGRRGRFKLLSKKLVDAQRLIIEESPESLIGGEQPKRISVFLKEDLVEPRLEKTTTPGSKVKVVGVIKEVPILLKSGVQSIRYDLMMDANSIDLVEESFADIDINEEDEQEIKELAQDPRIHERLVKSIAPSIYGHDDIKEALILQLVGGVQKERDDGIKTRGDMHVLLIGDPGSGKSALLTFISKIAPKGRLVSGKGVSSAGITASVVRDEFLKGWALEAGALVLSSGGTCIIDEMDKIHPEDTAAMHQAMEQQIVTISKANIQACYSSDTEVLTNKGWKKYQEVKELKIAQYDPSNKTIQFLPHKGLYEYNYKSKMYNFKNKRNDILVTPNHKMLAKEYSQKEYREIKAENLNYSTTHFLNSGNFIGKEEQYFILPPIKHKQNRKHPKYTHQHKSKKIPMDLWLEFLGYFLSEGGLQKEPTIGIPQEPGENCNKIRKCLSKLSNSVGFTLTESKDQKYSRFQITNTQLFRFLEENCGKKCNEKKYPLDLSSLSKKQLKILYDALMLGDGCSKGKYYSSTSPELTDLFQGIACLIGKSANKGIHYKAHGNRLTCYRVTLCDKTNPSIKNKFIKKISYNGKVFCFSTKTGFFITRRNGKIAIQGNTLKTETTVLAAANPKLGRFDPYKLVAEQIDMPPTLINRFDLIFPIKDIPSKEKDEQIATHVLNLQQKPKSLEFEIPLDLLRKFIAYAKQKVKPRLTDNAIDEIKNFYVNLRNQETTSDDALRPIPITARQLEGLVRLAEASAKLRLSKKVTRSDAKRAIKLLKHCLMQVGFDQETGQIDIDRVSTTISASQRGKISLLREIIEQLEEKVGKTVPIEDIVAEAEEKGITEDRVEEIIERMKREGLVFEPKTGFIQRI